MSEEPKVFIKPGEREYTEDPTKPKPKKQFNIVKFDPKTKRPRKLLYQTDYDYELEVTSENQRKNMFGVESSRVTVEHYLYNKKQRNDRFKLEIIKKIPHPENMLVPAGWKPKPMVTVSEKPKG